MPYGTELDVEVKKITNNSFLAAGSAYAFKRAQNGLIVICYFGEGAASEGIVFVYCFNDTRL